ncbi:MAG: G-D-S-L family lipolytic protein [Acidobacteriota bacterium]|nr:G-D-S-L family lipolytic protein [Acidobacteriota bacterium]
MKQKKASVFALLAALCVALWGCAGAGNGTVAGQSQGDSLAAGPSQAYTDGTVIEPDDASLHYTGRWDKSHLAEEAITVNSGSLIRFAFTGRTIHGRFGTQGITRPAQIYASIDGHRPQLFTLDSQLINFTPTPLGDGRHTIEVAVKDVDERANRWVPPLASAVIFKGFILDPGAKALALTAPSSLKMEFYGDSITQGVRALNMAIGVNGSDGTTDYAFLTAGAFGAQSNQVGFGRQGIIRTGNGEVPPAGQSFGWNFQGSRADPSFIPRVVVVNQGTNDGVYPSAQFEPAYRAYIEEIRKAYPQAAIFCMRPFGGFHEKDIRQAVKSIADPKIFYVDTTGWLSKDDFTDGVHPTVAGHLKAAKDLIRVIAEHTGLKPVRSVDEPWWK